MMRAERARLEDIHKSIETIQRCVQGMDEEGFITAFTHNEMLADTISYRFVVIGEAVKSMLGDSEDAIPPADAIKRNIEIDWKGYAAMRNIFAHQYFRRNPKKIRAAIENELPILKMTVEFELQREGSSPS